MLKYFLHLSIVWQVALAPALLLAMTGGAFWWIDSNTEHSLTAFEAANQQSLQDVTAIYKASATRLQHIDEFVITINKVDSDVWRHISLVGSGLSDAELARIRAAIAAGLARASQLLVADDAKDATSANSALLAGYAQAVTRIGDVAERDRTKAIGLVAPMEAKLQELDRTFLALRDARQAADQDAAAQVGRRSSDTIRRVRTLAAVVRINRWGVAACVFAIGVVLSLLIGRGIAKPLTAITRTMTKLARGDLDVDVPAADRNDEVGQMARAVAVVKDHMIAEERRTAGQTQAPRQAAAEQPADMIDTATNRPAETVTVPEQMRQRATAMTAAAERMPSAAGRPGDAANTAAVQAMHRASAEATATGELAPATQAAGNQPVTGRTENQATIATPDHEREPIGAVAARTSPPVPNTAIEAARGGPATNTSKGSNRPAAARISNGLPCQLTIADELHTCRVSELSGTGASVTGVSPYPTGTPGKLSIEGVGMPLPVKVRATDDNALKLTFVLDVATRFKVSEKLDRLAKELAA